VSRLVAVMVGITTPGLDDAAVDAFRGLRSAGLAVPLFAGGAAVRDETHAHELGADHWSGWDGRYAVQAVERTVGSAAPGA
jgi:hypothetical protein